MQSVTLTIALIGSLLVVFLKPPKAFAVFVISLLFYPTFLTVQVGTANLMVGRIIVSVLLLRCLLNDTIRKNFRWNTLDSWVTFGAVVGFCIPLLTWSIPFLARVENRVGSLMDGYFMYWVARLCVQNHSALTVAIKWIAMALVPLAVLGMIEAATGWQPYAALRVYCPWHWEVAEGSVRHDFFRAVGPFGHPILFGAAFAMFLPLVYALRHEPHWKIPAYLLSAFAILGALSSMSSGPWMMVILIVAFLALEHKKQWVKPLIFMTISGIIFVGVMSNRTFYHVIASYADPLGGSGWHRARLIDLAIEHFDQWWLAGYGGQDPGWGPSLGMTWTDITNHYIGMAVSVGLLGVISLVGILVTAMRIICQQHKSTKNPRLKSWYWAFGVVIAMLIIAFNSCTLFAQAATLFYCILGLTGSTYNLRPSMPQIKTKHGNKEIKYFGLLHNHKIPDNRTQ